MVIPNTVFWEITEECNLRCRHCYLGKRNKATTYQFAKEKALAHLDALYKGGIKTVLFMGGEPLLYGNIFELVRVAGSFGYGLHAAILTNGLLLSEEVVVRLKRNGISAVQVSIDGVGDSYKFIRGIDFAVIDENIKRLKKNKIVVQAKFTITEKNLHEFEDVWRYCSENKIFLSTSLILGIGRAKESLVLRPRDYFSFSHKLFELNKKSKLIGMRPFLLPDFSIGEYLENGVPETGCVAGRGMFGITRDNKLVPCIYLSNFDTRKFFDFEFPEFDENFLVTINRHPLFKFFREESSKYFGCPIRKRIYGGKDPFSVYEFAETF